MKNSIHIEDVALSLRRHKREASAAAAYLALLGTVAVAAPGFFTAANWRDLALQNAPALMVATGMTLVILTGNIDISVGSQFAVCSVAAGAIAKAGLPASALIPTLIAIGCLLGTVNGLLIARFNIPSIVVTLATLVIWRDGLRWVTQGSWVQNLPSGFQWLGLGQTVGQSTIIALSLSLFGFFAWLLNSVAAGRSLYAVGSDAEAARLAGIEGKRVVLGVFALMGALTGMAALLNSIRFAEVPSNAGTGLELKVIAAVVVGGTAITGGRGTLLGTLIGVALLGTIATALVFLGINPFWEKAIQGAIILAALGSEKALQRRHVNIQSANAESG